MRPDQPDGLIRYPVRQILPVRPLRKRLDPIRSEISLMRMAPGAAADIDVKAHLIRIIRFSSQMPFAHVPGCVAAVFQRLRHRILPLRKMLHIRRIDHPAPERMAGSLHPMSSSRINRIFGLFIAFSPFLKNSFRNFISFFESGHIPDTFSLYDECQIEEQHQLLHYLPPHKTERPP